MGTDCEVLLLDMKMFGKHKQEEYTDTYRRMMETAMRQLFVTFV